MAEIIPMIALSPTMETGTITTWKVGEGDTVSPGDILCEVETDKAAMEYESTVEGTILKIFIAEGEQASVGEPIAAAGKPGEAVPDVPRRSPVKSGTPDAAPRSGERAGEPAEKSDAAPAPGGPVRSSPLARRLAEERGVDIRSVRGSGPGNRVVKRDIEAAAAAPGGPAPSSVSGGPDGPAGEDRTVPVSLKRAGIAERLSDSMFTAPHFYMNVDVDMHAVITARAEYNKRGGIRIGMNSIIMKIAARALMRNRALNSSWQGDRIVQYGRADIALAVAQEEGLITPVVRRCEQKSIVRIERELAALIDKARKNLLQPGEYSNGTFTVSNLGSFGIDGFSAILNPPQSAILAVGAVRSKPVAGENNALVVRPVATLTLSCDHRAVDGVAAAAFMADLRRLMEVPLLLTIE